MLAGVLPLLKKDFCESINNFKAKKCGYGVLGYVMHFTFIAAVLVTAVFLYAFITSNYINLAGNTHLLLLRQKELLTVTLALIFVFTVFTGVKKIYKKIVIGADMDKLKVLPISNKELFVYKIVYIFASQFITSLITILTFAITFGVVCKVESLFYVMMALTIIIFPFITMGVSALLVVPYYYFVKFTHSRYYLLIIIYAVLFAGIFVLYSVFLDAINNILISGGLSSFFNEERFNIIQNIVEFLFPNNFIALMMLGENVFVGFAIMLSIAVTSVLVLLILVAKVFPFLSDDSMEERKTKFVTKVNFNKKGKFSTLLSKEFTSILRRPNYAFSLFSVSLTLPVLVFLCTRLLSMLVKNVVYININFVLALFVLSTFTILTNTFCASNVSREGKKFYKHMLLPLSNFQILLPKVFICFLVSAVGVVCSGVLLMCTHYVTVPQGLFMIAVVLLLSLAENLFATKYDLLRPSIVRNRSGENDVATSSSNVSLVLSFMIVLALIGFILLYSVFKVLKGEVVSPLILYLLPAGVSIVLCALAILYFMHKLEKIKVVEE